MCVCVCVCVCVFSSVDVSLKLKKSVYECNEGNSPPEGVYTHVRLPQSVFMVHFTQCYLNALYIMEINFYVYIYLFIFFHIFVYIYFLMYLFINNNSPALLGLWQWSKDEGGGVRV